MHISKAPFPSELKAEKQAPHSPVELHYSQDLYIGLHYPV